MRTALIAGATGLTGGHALKLLLEEPAYQNVIALTRHRLAETHPKLTQHVVDFDNLAAAADLLRADDIYCCLGTTIRVAGSQQAFRRVDFEYPLRLAQLAQANGARQFLLVSSLGASAKSGVFYSRVKGELEEALRQIPFGSLQIFRPSFLLGERSESRWAENLSAPVLKFVRPLLLGPLKKMRAIKSEDVAQAMVLAAHKAQPGVTVYESDAIQKLACTPG